MRLYETAWVHVEGLEQPLPVQKDRRNPGIFHVGDYQYDIDGRALPKNDGAPRLMGILSLQAAREAGLKQDYNSDIRGDI